jgi:hypothetical protein
MAFFRLACPVRRPRRDLGLVLPLHQGPRRVLARRLGRARAHRARGPDPARRPRCAARPASARWRRLAPPRRGRAAHERRAVHALRAWRAARDVDRRGAVERDRAAVRARLHARAAARGAPGPPADRLASRSASRAWSCCSGRGAASAATRSWATARASWRRRPTGSARRTRAGTWPGGRSRGVSLAAGQLLCATAMLAVAVPFAGVPSFGSAGTRSRACSCSACSAAGVAYVLTYGIVRAAGATTFSTVGVPHPDRVDGAGRRRARRGPVVARARRRAGGAGRDRGLVRGASAAEHVVDRTAGPRGSAPPVPRPARPAPASAPRR